MFDPVANHKEARKFMVSRRVSRETCEKLAIEYDPDKRRVVFPVRNGQNQLYGWSGRTVIAGHEPKVLDYAGLPKRHLILGEHRWRPGYQKLIVEGLIAYARMHEIGAEEHVDIGALLGTTCTPEKAAIMLAHNCTILAMPDPDKAGAQCLYGIWDQEANDGEGAFKGGGLIDQVAGEIPVRVPYFPQGVKDIDDIELVDLLRVIESAPMAFPAPKVLDKKSRAS